MKPVVAVRKVTGQTHVQISLLSLRCRFPPRPIHGTGVVLKLPSTRSMTLPQASRGQSRRQCLWRIPTLDTGIARDTGGLRHTHATG